MVSAEGSGGVSAEAGVGFSALRGWWSCGARGLEAEGGGGFTETFSKSFNANHGNQSAISGVTRDPLAGFW